jgi:tetratricopeptide (TPR) repeat protein
MEALAGASEEVLRHARLSGYGQWRTETLELALLMGPRPADEALERLDAFVPDGTSPGMNLTRAVLIAMLGRVEEGLCIALRARDELNDMRGEARGSSFLAEIEWLAGDRPAAVEEMSRVCAFIEQRGHLAHLSYYGPRLGRMLCGLGRYDEAAPLAAAGREHTATGDRAAEVAWRQTQALVDSRRGRHADAEALALEAVALAEKTDFLSHQADALSDLAEVLANAGKPEEARAAFEQALDRYERKRNVVLAAYVRERLAALPA